MHTSGSDALAPSVLAPSPGKPVLLIVDDDSLIADTLGYYLGEDFQVATAGSRPAAIEWLQRQPEPPPLALIEDRKSVV